MNLFFSENISKGFSTFPEIESKHAIQVLRKKAGDQVFFVDGHGGYYEGIIQDPHPKRCLIQIINHTPEYGKRDYGLHMAVAPTKNIDRFEWFLEKATEIGIDRITPIFTFHSERKQVKLERLNRVITSAMKQSLKAYHPILEEALTFKQFMNQDFEATKLIAHCESTTLASLKNAIKPKTKTLILIGPEGDFNTEEIKLAESKGFTSITLGNSRLRTETAAVVAAHSVYFINQ